MTRIFIFFIFIYQKFISPKLPRMCRYKPSCSEYTKQAIKKYGFLQGGLMGWRRIKRCNPNGGSGFDPLP